MWAVSVNASRATNRPPLRAGGAGIPRGELLSERPAPFPVKVGTGVRQAAASAPGRGAALPTRPTHRVVRSRVGATEPPPWWSALIPVGFGRSLEASG